MCWKDVEVLSFVLQELCERSKVGQITLVTDNTAP
jgi:hypothetical protein